MAEDIITVGIAVRCNTVFYLFQFLRRMTFDNSAQITLEACINIRISCLHCFIEGALFCLWLTLFDCSRINQVNLFIFLHLTKSNCCIMGIPGFCHKRKLESAHSSLNSVLPFLVPDIEHICKDIDLNGTSIKVAESALQCASCFL